MTHGEAYRKGWMASKRTTTYDMDKAYERFCNRNNIGSWEAYYVSFTDGWIDYAADNEFDDKYRWDLTVPA